MQRLSAAESLWVDTARAVELPDFDVTITEYQSLSDSDSASFTSRDSSVSDEGWDGTPHVGVMQRAPIVVDSRVEM